MAWWRRARDNRHTEVLAAIGRVGAQITMLSGQLSNLKGAFMSDLSALKAGVADLTSKVAAQTSIDASVATLVQNIVAQNKALADQIAALQAGDVDQSDIDALAQQVRDQATALDQGTQQLQAAVPQNTPADSGNSSQGQTPGQPAQS